MIQKNPYIAGPPIEDEKQFFGRKELIRKLMQGIRSSSQNAFFLHGPRSIGKTSLLKQLEYNLCDEGYTQVYFDLNGKSRLYLTELLYEIAQAIADACAFQPPRQENFDQDGRYFLQVFLPQIEKASPKSNVVLLFDAFDSNAMARAGQAAKVFLPFLLNHLRSFQKVKILYCLNSDCEHLLLKSKNSAFFQIPRLSKSETATLVRQSEAGGTLLWEKAAIEHVWNLTHGHPFLAQVICNFTWAAARNAKNGNIPTTTPDDVEAACEAALPKIKKLFQQVLQKLHPPEQAMFGTIVKYCSGNFDGQQLHNLLQKNRIQIPHNEIPSILKKLARVDVIEVVDAKKKLFGIAVPLFSAWAAGQKTLENTVDKSPAIDLREQGTESPNALMRAVNEALALENQDNWAAAIKIYESLLEKYPKNNELRSKLHHARNQERLANRYNKALNAISCGDCEDAQKLLAEVILRDPAYKEASRFLLLATTGIDAKEMEQKLDHENEELKRARSQIVELQDKIANAKHDDADLAVRKKQVKKREQSIAKMEEKEHEKLSKLAAAKEEINQLKTAYPAKTPRKESNQTTPTQDALVTLDTLLDAKEKTEPKDVKFTRPEEIQYEDHAKPRTASTTIPASKYRHQESQKKTGSQHPKTADKTTTTEVRKEARKKHAPQDVTLNVTLATLDDLLDDPVRAQPDEKETSFLHAQTEPENENPAPAKKHEATADLPNTEEQRQSIALTDTAMIDAGQVEKLPDQPQQSEESSEESQSSYLAESQPNNHIEIAPIDENGSTSSFPDDRDDFLPENGPPKNIEIPFQPNRSQSRADFRKRVLAKKNTLKEQKRKKMQAGWIAGTLNSLPVFVWVLWLWYVQPVEWGNGGKIFVLITSVPAWLAACRFGASDKAKHITSFFALTPVVSFCFYAILTFETLRPGVPSLTNSNHELLIIAGLIYIAVIAIIAGISGQVASVVSIGTIGGAFAGAALFFNNGGAIEATLILAIITAVMLILKRVDAGSAAGAGVMAGIPAGFLLFALTFHLTAPNLNISLQAGGVSLAAYATAAGLAYVINTVTTKMNAKSPS